MQSDHEGSCQRICVLIMRIQRQKPKINERFESRTQLFGQASVAPLTKKLEDSGFLRRSKNMVVEGRTVSYFHILVICKYILIIC